MSAEEFRRAVDELKIPLSLLPIMLGVTRRSVGYWLVSERSVPGPVVAYLRVLKEVPLALDREIAAAVRTKGKS